MARVLLLTALVLNLTVGPVPVAMAEDSKPASPPAGAPASPTATTPSASAGDATAQTPPAASAPAAPAPAAPAAPATASPPPPPPPAAAADASACPKKIPTWLKDPSSPTAVKSKVIFAGYKTKNPKICAEINEQFQKDGDTGIFANKEFLARLQTEIDALKKSHSKPAKAHRPIVADQYTPDSVEPGSGSDNDFKPDKAAGQAGCIACKAKRGPAPPVPEHVQRDYNDIVGAMPERPAPPPPPPVAFHPATAVPVGGGIGNDNIWWGLGGALVGGIFGYALGRNSAQQNYNSLYGNYGYGGWAGSQYIPGYNGGGAFGYGGLPPMYRAPGTYGMTPPMFLPYPGPGGGYMTPTGLGYGAIGAGYGGGMGMVPGGGGYGMGMGGMGGMSGYSYPGIGGVAGSNLCTNCVLPTMYPAPRY